MAVIDKFNALRLEQFDLSVCPAEGKSGGHFPVPFYYSVARDDAGLRIDVKRIAYDPGKPAVSGRFRYLSIGGHASFRDKLYNLVNFFKRRHRNTSPKIIAEFSVVPNRKRRSDKSTGKLRDIISIFHMQVKKLQPEKNIICSDEHRPGRAYQIINCNPFILCYNPITEARGKLLLSCI